MKDFTLLIWLTQLGLSIALPLAGFIFLALWLQRSFGWGNWILWIGILLGAAAAIDGFRHALRTMEHMRSSKSSDDPPPVSFNEHD